MTVFSIYAPVTRMGNGATVIFDFPYQFFAPSDLVVSLYDLTGNVVVAPPPLLNGAASFDYTVTGTIDALGTGEYLNGSVTFNKPPPGNYQVTIERRIAAVQPVALADDSLFPAKTVEAEFDRLQMQIQGNTYGLARAILVPPGETGTNLVLPPAGSRGDKFLGFDASGNVVVEDAPSLVVTAAGAIWASTMAAMKAVALTAAMVGTFITLTGYYADGDSGADRRYKITNVNPGPADDGVTVASNTPGYWLVWQNVPDTIDIRKYGAVMDDATEAFGPFQRLQAYINARGYGGMFVPGKMTVSFDLWRAFGVITMTPQGLMRICGRGMARSRIRFTGAAGIFAHWIFENCGEFRVEDIELYGNSLGGGGSGFFMQLHQTSAAVERMEQLHFVRARFANFQQCKWISAQNDGNLPMRVRVNACSFKSLPGNSFNPASLGEAATMISLKGNSNGKVLGTISDNNADGTHVKRFVDCWGDTVDVMIHENILGEFGQVGANDNCGAYAIMAYQDSGNSPFNINVYKNRIINPRSCGVYTAIDATGLVNVDYNYISGQTDTVNATLPKGAIALNGAIGTYTHNEISGCFGGIWSNGQYGNAAHINANSIYGTVANAVGIALKGNAITPTPFAHHLCNDNDIQLDGAGSIAYVLVGLSAAPLGYIQIFGGRASGNYTALTADAGGGAGGIVCSSLQIGGGLYLIGNASNYLVNLQSSVSPIFITDLIADGTGTASHVLGLSANTNLRIDGLKLMNKASSGGAKVMLVLYGCRGSMRNVETINVAPDSVFLSDGFGQSTPNWAADQGTFIQNLAERAVGTGGSIYAVEGWGKDTAANAWTERRRLTGT